MTTLRNSILIEAAPDRVWEALACLDALQRYDPGIAKSEVQSTIQKGWARHASVTFGPVDGFGSG